MKKEIRMEQHFAVSKDGILTDIKTAHESPEDFYCPHCHCKMIKKCGAIRSWHFAHDFHNANEDQKNCTNETYLHGYAKLRIKQWFDESQSIILNFAESTICPHHDVCQLKSSAYDCKIILPHQTDLKKVFTSCEIEQTVNVGNKEFRADLLLTGPNVNSLLIEIFVTHECSEEKKESDLKIIEFYITSEEDVEYIISHDITTSENVKFYGIDITNKDDGSNIPQKYNNIQKFIFYKSGKIFTTSLNCQEAYKRKGVFEVIFAPHIQIDKGLLSVYGLLLAQEYGFNPKNCCICKHFSSNENKRLCIKNNMSIKNGADALTCSDFQFKDTFHLPPPTSILDVWNSQSAVDNCSSENH
ncbi:MAG: competence protein CoiA [Bacteroides sp.]|nr:competence protein CoiA [Bacteroides sp.]MCM1457845.1 competence protein CoiA [Lachnoclostridium sp.]